MNGYSRLVAPALSLALILLLPHESARAQSGRAPRLSPVGRVDLFGTTLDRWRGIRQNAHPVAELDALVGLEGGGVSFTAGGWTTLETKSTRNEPRPDLRAGPARFSDWSAWGQLAGRRGASSVSTGVIRDWYARPGSNPAVTEVYGAARLQTGRWSHSIALWQAVSGADGLYVEPAVAFHHFVNPFTGPAVSLTTTLRAGIQAGKRNPDGGPKVPGPQETGLTHVALGTTLRLGFNLTGPVALVLVTTPELQANRDPATKLRRDGSSTGWLRFWWPLQLGLSCPLRRPE
jgi:hypothetical protein